jgi:hypothetical protein
MFFKTFHLQIDAIRSTAGDIEQVEAMVAEKKALLKNSKDVYEFDSCLCIAGGLEWLLLLTEPGIYGTFWLLSLPFRIGVMAAVVAAVN